MNDDAIVLSKEEGIATITLNRPDSLNSLTPDGICKLSQMTRELKNDDEVKVVILTGAGRGFCAGFDLSEIASGGYDQQRFVKLMSFLNEIPLNLREMPKPTIAMVNGVAAGVGCNLCLACDIIIASEKARFGEVFVRTAGVHPDGGGSYFLPHLVGIHRACELLFTGKVISASEADRIGMINRVVPHEQLESNVKELALDITKVAPIPLRMLKTSIYKALGTDLSTALEAETRAQAVCFFTEDAKEAARAFAEKRQPEFKGK